MRRKNVPEQLPRGVTAALLPDLNSPTSDMKESGNSVSALSSHCAAPDSMSLSSAVKLSNNNKSELFNDVIMPELSIERQESESDCPLKIDTQFSIRHEHDPPLSHQVDDTAPLSPNVSIGSEGSLNETGEFDDAEDSNDPKRKCREETKIHPYERHGHVELFRCPLCLTDAIESRKNLTNHLRLHQNKEKRDDGKHLCCLCSHELSSNSSLERHLLTHTNFRPFTCKYCSKSFTTNGNLSRHIKTTHTGTSLVDNTATLEQNASESPLQSQKAVRKVKSPKKTHNSENNAQPIGSLKEDMIESRNMPSTLALPNRPNVGKEFPASDIDMLPSNSTSAQLPLMPTIPTTTLPGQHSYFPNLPTTAPYSSYLGNKALSSQLASIYCQSQMQNSQLRAKFPFYSAPHPTINPLFPSIFMPGQNLDSMVRLPNHSDFGVLIPPAMSFMPLQQSQQKLMDFDSRNSSLHSSLQSNSQNASPTKKQRERKQRKSSVALNNNSPKSKKLKPDILKLTHSGSVLPTQSKSGESGLDLSVNSVFKGVAPMKSQPSLIPLVIEEKSPLPPVKKVNKLSKLIYRRLYQKIRHTVFFSCPLCKKTCQKNFNMLAHRALIHPQNGVHQCPSCNFSSVQPREIFDHIRKHCRVLRPIKKRILNKSSSSSRNLYRCWYFTSCTKRFSNWSQTKHHMTVNHNQDGNPFDIITKQLLLTPEQHSDEEMTTIQPIFNSTPLDFSLTKLKQEQSKGLEEKAKVLQHKTEPLSIEPMSSPDDAYEGALDLSFRSSTQSLHLSGYSSMDTDHSKEQSDYQNNNINKHSMDCSPWSNLKQPFHSQVALPPPIPHTVMYNQQQNINDNDVDRKSGQFAIRRPKKSSNLSKPQINPDYVQPQAPPSSTGIENSFWSSYKTSNSFSSFASECIPSGLAYQGYLPFQQQNGSINDNNSESYGNAKPKKSISSIVSEDHNSDHQKINYSEEDDIQMKKLLKKKNSYKDAPKLITCPVPGCLQKFPWHSSLKRHIITHTEHKPYKCTRCHKSFSTKSNRERHMERLHGVSVKKAKRFQVKNNSLGHKMDEVSSDGEMNHCGSISSNDSDSGLHISTQNNISSRFLSDSELKEEEILSMDNNDRQAETISTNLLMQAGEPQIEPNPERFSSIGSNRSGIATYKKSVLTSQKTSLSPEPPMYFHKNWSPTGLPPSTNFLSFDSISTELPNCFQRFESSSSSSVDLSTTFKCPFCGYNFSNRIKTLEHFSREHTSEWSMLMKKMNARDVQDVVLRHNSPPQSSDSLSGGGGDCGGGGDSDLSAPARTVQCCVCLHKFQSFQDLQRHARSHTGARPFVCSICSKEFSLKHSMQRHLRAHSDDANNISDVI